MEPKRRKLLLRLGHGGLWLIAASALLAARLTWPPRHPDAIGPVAWRDLALTLGLFVLAMALAHSAGSVVLRRLQLEGTTALERALFSLGLGIGILGYSVTALALLGQLRTTGLAVLLAAMAAALGRQLSSLAQGVARVLRRLPRAWAAAPTIGRAFLVLAIPIGLLALVQALAPPWDYDGLMYHLAGPQRFLHAGRLYPDTDNWYINGPFTLEMVFSLGMAFGDDVFPRLIHYATGVMLVAATYAAGRRWLGERGGWIAAAVLLSVPTLPIWASFAYIDLGWSLYEFLALFAVLLWVEHQQRRWLVLGGLLLGLALGSKYLALMGSVLLLGLIGLRALQQGARQTLIALLAFGLPALAVGGPWYLKNLIWLGNPVYPFFFGGPGWSPERLALYSAYLNSFGTGQTPADFLLIPWNAYAQHARFGTTMNRIDIPSPLFPLVLAAPFLRKGRITSALLWLSLARMVFWAIGSQQLRFLLPVYPALSIATADVIGRLLPAAPTHRRLWHVFLPALALGCVTLTLFYQIVALGTYQPLGYLAGRENRSSFLARTVGDYAASRFIADRLPASSRVLLLGDGRGYYCGVKCLPDSDHFRWSAEISGLESNEALASWFHQQGITHIVLSIEDLDFLLQHDPQGVVRAALDRLLLWRDAGCLVERFEDARTSVWEIACP